MVKNKTFSFSFNNDHMISAPLIMIVIFLSRSDIKSSQMLDSLEMISSNGSLCSGTSVASEERECVRE